VTAIYRCPKCEAKFDPPREERSECPKCGIWFHKWNAPLPVAPVVTVDAIEEAEEAVPPPDDITYYGRAAALVLVAVWGIFLAADDYTDPPANFMHNIILPIHEAGHVFFRAFGEFMHWAGGSLFQLLLPFGIGVAFYVKQRDPFGAAMCLWWTGASLVDLSPYIYDALYPKLTLLGGHTGESGGPHDWIYILETLGWRQRAQGLGIFTHRLGIVVMIGAVAWGARWLWRMAPWRREGPK
jgi:hypothetical protein